MAVQTFTVYDMITRGALVHGDAPAIVHGEREISFREFRRRVDALAGGLGLDALRSALDRLVASAPTAVDRGRPRLWVDRSFAARGSGMRSSFQ